MRRLVLSNRADQDLIDLWSYIGINDSAAADRLLDAFDLRFRQLTEFPLSGIARDDITIGLRHLVCRNYLILYRCFGDTVEILRVVHGSRDFRDIEPD